MARAVVTQRAAMFVQLTYLYQNVRTGSVLGTRKIGDLAVDVENWARTNNIYLRNSGTLNIQDNFAELNFEDVDQSGQLDAAGRENPIQPAENEKQDVLVTIHKATIFIVGDQMQEEITNVDNTKKPAQTAAIEPGSIVFADDPGVRNVPVKDVQRGPGK